MANISFSSKRGLIRHGFKDVAIRQKKESDHWSKLEAGQDLKVYWKMRSKESEVLRETRLAEDALVIEFDDISEKLADRAGYDSVDDLKDHLKDKYGEDYKEHEYVVIMWEI